MRRTFVLVASSDILCVSFCLSRITGAPLTATTFRAPSDETADLRRQLFSGLLSVRNRVVLPWIDIISEDNASFCVLTKMSTGMPLPIFWKVYRAVEGSDAAFRVIRLLVTFILTVENQVQSSLIKILVYSLANCHDLTVNGDGFLVLYIDGPKLISRLPLVMRPVLGLQQQFLWRIMTHLLKDPDRVGDTTVEPPSLSQLHGWPDKVLYFLRDLCAYPVVLSVGVADTCSYLSSYPNPWHIPLHTLRANPVSSSLNSVQSSELFGESMELLNTYIDMNSRLRQPEFKGLLLTAEIYPWKIPVGALARAYMYGRSTLAVEEAFSLAMQRGNYGILAGMAHLCKSTNIKLTSLMLEVLRQADPDVSCCSFVLSEKDKETLWLNSTHGYSALMFAVLTRNKTIVECILPHEVTMTNACGHSALAIARQLRLEPICAVLTRYLPTYDAFGNTYLHTVVQENGENTDAIKQHIFLSQIQNSAGEYAIMIAYRLKKYKVLSVLSQSEGRLVHPVTICHNNLSISKLSVLQLAALDGDGAAVRAVKQYGHSVVTDHGYTALMFAAERGHSDIVRELAPFEARQTNDAGKTALLLAICAGHLDVVKVLADYETRLTDSTGWCPLEQAVRRSRIGMVEVLAPYEAKIFGARAIDAVDSSAFIAQANRRSIKEIIRKYM
ncbi:Ankyrin repeat protein 1 [Giardia duodenalis]|uniref:Ankyrin repeat protein 1 n=1 Tax=Giardia intestinalis (strain ATCC 50803 / WB clone C6) TaxID=184922 RepID=A8BSH4_GIAIC|nr:Ankyrin repeat protein 1 [Giardia intestinalis]KAE8304707.1 Ankyrin repeat protein 1 [Giardia intestinalis]|eukprot:XP_001705107.1 Protein 21.1 [Giardia lamblia ATCC 50803]